MINFQMMIHTIGKLPNKTIREYISIRYERWLDYCRYKCSKSGLGGEENDVLNEVLLNVLQKDEQLLMKLYRTKKVQKGKEFTELDFFILKALDLNITSETSPYRYKNKCIPRANIEVSRLKIVDETYHQFDISTQILKEIRLITWVLKGLDLTESERRVFEHKFLHGNSLCGDWHGPETRKERYQIYKNIETTIHNVLYHYGLTNLAPKKECTKRQADLAEAFVKSHKIHKQQKEFSH